MPEPQAPPAAAPSDRSVEDFAAGAADAGLYLSPTSTGPEVILAPAAAADFQRDGLPTNWFSEPWKDGGRVTHRDGMLLLEAATVGLHGLYPSERSLEFRATFQKRPHQHIGFGTTFRTVPWITFSTKFGHGLYARTNFVLPEENRLPTALVGSPHRFRIEWNVLEVEFWVDGKRLAHQLVPMVGYMRPLASNASLGPDPLAVEWMRMSPYAPEGIFTSRVHDAGVGASWSGCELDAEIPPNTSVEVVMRSGGTAEPGEGWSQWSPGDGTSAGLTGRYAQYRMTLATSDSRWTPVVRGVGLRCSSLDGARLPSPAQSSTSSSSSSGPSITGGTSGA